MKPKSFTKPALVSKAHQSSFRFLLGKTFPDRAGEICSICCKIIAQDHQDELVSVAFHQITKTNEDKQMPLVDNLVFP